MGQNDDDNMIVVPIDKACFQKISRIYDLQLYKYNKDH